MISVYGVNGIHVQSPNYMNVTGAVQFNGNTGKLQVSTGSGWVDISSGQCIGLDTATLVVIDWARKKMQQERELLEMAEEFPAVKEAVLEVERAQRDLDAVLALCGAEQ